MITIRPSAQRGHFNHGWLDTYHTFSFGQYYDPRFMGFRALRVINEDVVRAGRGFATHPHDNMEIITYVLSGGLAHKDSTGSSGTIHAGEVQRMSAGRGILHSESNPSRDMPVHLLQIWLEPSERDIEPEYEQRPLPSATPGALPVIASPDGAHGSMRIHADARLLAGRLEAGQTIEIPLTLGGHGWVQVAAGSVQLDGHSLSAGDGASLEGEQSVRLSASEPATVLVFDLA